MRLGPEHSVEAVRAGKFVVARGRDFDFFCMITDVRLDASSQSILREPPGRDTLLAEVLSGEHTFATVSLKPMLMMQRKDGGGVDREEDLRPVKSIPVHFSPVREATSADVNQIFGAEREKNFRYFHLGAPLDMDDVEVCLDLDRFVERSNGIFGKTGTGKTFLTRLVLAGLIRNNKCVNLIFDMHSEYGSQTRRESGDGKDSFVQGLRDIFGPKVMIFTMDPESAHARRVRFDYEVEISLSSIEVEDVATLQDELRLHPTAIETAYILRNRFKAHWLLKLLDQDPAGLKVFADEIGANKESLAALYRKMQMVERLPFVVRKEEAKIEGAKSSKASIERIIQELRGGKHVDLEFGRVSNMLAYLLVANLVTRRIHEKWVKDAEKYMATQKREDRPPQLLITIEEAHKFLNPAAARQTIFGTIARELRKYFVSLLIVDQRPSGIDDEILSQIGTRITALLNDEKDIQAVFTGVSGAAALRHVLAGLDTRQQALVLGHATPMPVVIKTRDYNETFFEAMGKRTGEAKAAELQGVIDLFPEE